MLTARADGGGIRRIHEGAIRTRSARSAGERSVWFPSARTAMRVLRTPSSMSRRRTASARDSDTRRAWLGEEPSALA